jgi:hypothetical protein
MTPSRDGLTLTHAQALCSTIGAAALMSLYACASSSSHLLSAYQAPPSSAPIAELLGDSMAAAGLPTHRSVGHVVFIDGTAAPSFSGTVRLAPGTHSVGIDCSTKQPSNGPYGFTWNVQHVSITGPFAAGQKYYVRCEALDGDSARTWISDSPDAPSLPQGFSSVCTRSCPGSTN